MYLQELGEINASFEEEKSQAIKVFINTCDTSIIDRFTVGSWITYTWKNDGS